MKKIVLKDITLSSRTFKRLDILLHSDGSLVLLPTLFSIYTYNRSLSLVMRDVRNEMLSQDVYRQTEINEQQIAFGTCVAYVARVFEFAKYCDNLKEAHLDMNNNKFMNLYLNEVLGKRVKSVTTLELAKRALTSYRLFLSTLRIGDIPSLTLNREVLANLNSSKIVHSASDYVSREERSLIMQACRNERDRLIIRCGYQLGLRTSENRALCLHDQKIKGVTKPGLLSLFKQLDSSQQETFVYTLNGIYTKYKKSRDIYIPRTLLEAFRSYYENERKQFIERHQVDDSIWLFIRYDPAGAGQQISERHATNIFNQALRDSNLENSSLSYHKLRHTFATEYYTSLIQKESGLGYSEATALFLVAKRLGHSKSGTTERYIRLMEDMSIIEGKLF